MSDLLDKLRFTPTESPTRLADASEDFNTLSAAGNDITQRHLVRRRHHVGGGRNEDKLYAYRVSDKARDAGKDFNTLSAAGNEHPVGIWSDGTTMWVSDYSDAKIYAYRMSDKAARCWQGLQHAGRGGKQISQRYLVGRHHHVGGGLQRQQALRLPDVRQDA